MLALDRPFGAVGIDALLRFADARAACLRSRARNRDSAPQLFAPRGSRGARRVAELLAEQLEAALRLRDSRALRRARARVERRPDPRSSSRSPAAHALIAPHPAPAADVANVKQTRGADRRKRGARHLQVLSREAVRRRCRTPATARRRTAPGTRSRRRCRQTPRARRRSRSARARLRAGSISSRQVPHARQPVDAHAVVIVDAAARSRATTTGPRAARCGRTSPHERPILRRWPESSR